MLVAVDELRLPRHLAVLLWLAVLWLLLLLRTALLVACWRRQVHLATCLRVCSVERCAFVFSVVGVEPPKHARQTRWCRVANNAWDRARWAVWKACHFPM